MVGAGTGGTSATIGRYVRYRRYDPALRRRPGGLGVLRRLVAADDPDASPARGSRIEGIGRPRVEPSFVRRCIDRMIEVPDAASVAIIRELERLLGRRAGGSTGTNLCGAFRIACEMRNAETTGSIVTLLCDPGERYADRYYSDDWLAAQEIDVTPHRHAFGETLRTGTWTAA